LVVAVGLEPSSSTLPQILKSQKQLFPELAVRLKQWLAALEFLEVAPAPVPLTVPPEVLRAVAPPLAVVLVALLAPALTTGVP